MEDNNGYVYILTNPSFREDWVKIGKSSRPVDVRSKELDNTAVPLPFEVYATLKTSKYNQAERLVHRYIERFTNLRIRDNREFFNVQPEVALDIFRDIAEILEDAEIEEVYKKSVIGDSKPSAKPMPVNTKYRDEVRVWMLPCNSKYFDVKGCLEKYGHVYWSQHFNLQKGDIGYLYSSNPDSAIRFKFEVVENDIPYREDMDKELEFYVDKNDFLPSKEHNRFVLLKWTGETYSPRLSLANLLDNGMKSAPRGALNLSHESFAELLKYIEENFK